MIWQTPGTVVYADLEGVATGLTGTVHVRVVSSVDGSVVVPRTSLNISELVPGTYRAIIQTLGIPAGPYLVVWDLGNVNDPNNTFTEELMLSASPPASAPITSWTPTKEQVARKIMSRTRDQFGNLVGDFTAGTTPTDTQVNALIPDAVVLVQDSIGDVIPEAVWDDAANLTALRAAMMVELSFYAEQVSTSRSPYAQLSAEYERELPRVVAAVESAELNADGQNLDPPSPNRPSFSFPDPGPITMDRVW